jgi:F-type H+-transporting ATPase subunit delta
MTMTQHQYSPVESVYAEALLGAARRLGVLQRAREDARVLLQVVKKNGRLLLFLESPHIAMQQKLELLDHVFEGRLCPLMMNLLRVLATRRRTTYLDETLMLFQELAERGEGIWRAEITTAHELDLQDQLRLKTALEKHAQKRLRIEYHLDDRLIGGVVCRLDDWQIDASLRHGLDELGRRLKATTLRTPEKAQGTTA